MSSQENLARQEKMLLRAVEEFVNTGDRSADWSRLKRRSPRLLPLEVYDLPFDRVHALNQQFGTTNVLARPDLGLDLLEPGMSYSPRRDGTGRFLLEPVELRDQLRRIWRDAQTANDILPTWFTVNTTENLLRYVLGLTDDAKCPGELYGYASNSEDKHELQTLMGSFTLRVDWARGSLVPQFETQFQRACYVLLKNSARAKFCPNPECPAPYFIARRATQKYCCLDCLKPFQKKWRLDWWNRAGSKRRRSANSKRSRGSCA